MLTLLSGCASQAISPPSERPQDNNADSVFIKNNVPCCIQRRERVAFYGPGDGNLGCPRCPNREPAPPPPALSLPPPPPPATTIYPTVFCAVQLAIDETQKVPGFSATD